MNAQDFVKRLEGRRDRWGIGLASIYLRQLERTGGPKCFDVSGERWAQLTKEAEGKLVYCDPSMVVESPVLAYDEGCDGFKWAAMPESQPDGGVIYRPVPVVKRAKRTPTPGAVMEFDAIVTSRREDRDGDVLDPKGAEVDPRLSLLWQHFPDQPIGKLLEVLSQNSKKLRARFAIIDTPLGRDAAQLVEFGALRLSHGFLPKEYEERTKGDGDDEEFVGWHIQRYEIMEVSLVSVPSNVDAVIAAYSRVGEKLCHPAVKEWAKGLYEGRPVMAQGADLSSVLVVGVGAAEAETPDDREAAEADAKDAKPYPNEHSCRLKPPGDYKTCRRTTRKHDGKEYSVLTCQRKDDAEKWEEQAFRYKKDVWTVAEAKTHCKEKGGAFHAATEATESEEKDTVPSKTDIGDWARRAVVCGEQLTAKAGCVLSKANESRILEARDDCQEIMKDGDTSRGVRAMASSAASKLGEVLESLPQEEEEKTPDDEHLAKFLLDVERYFQSSDRPDQDAARLAMELLIFHNGVHYPRLEWTDGNGIRNALAVTREFMAYKDDGTEVPLIEIAPSRQATLNDLCRRLLGRA